MVLQLSQGLRYLVAGIFLFLFVAMAILRGLPSPNAPAAEIRPPASPTGTFRYATLPVDPYEPIAVSTPLPLPGSVVTLVMHAYAPWIMCANWGLPELGRALGFST
eukprot:RCo020498